MKKIIHRLRNKPEEERRHILHFFTIVAGIIMILLWILSLGKTITDKDTQTRVKQDLQPLSALKDNMVGGFNSLKGQVSGNQNQ